MAYLEKLLPEFRKGAKIRLNDWDRRCFIYMKNNTVYDEDNKPLDGLEVDSYDVFSSDKWEFYQEPVDWDYVIKNKCLCWFWDGDGSQTINKLQCVGEGEFYDDCCRTWEYCRPVRRDEVTFYEDNKDE